MEGLPGDQRGKAKSQEPVNNKEGYSNNGMCLLSDYCLRPYSVRIKPTVKSARAQSRTQARLRHGKPHLLRL